MKEYTFKLYDNFLPNPNVIQKNNIIVNFHYCNLSELSWLDEDFNDNIFYLPDWIISFDASYNSIYAFYKGSSHDYLLSKDLQILNLSFNKLDFIPDKIPASIIALNVSNNTIKYIPKLPQNIQVVNASHNTIKWFDQELPDMQKLNLAHNRIHLFKFDRLRENLQFLDLSSNQLKSIDGGVFPTGLKILRLRDNRIEEIPELPEGLEEFDISDNKLKIIPNYPKSLKLLDVSSNYMEVISDSLMDCVELEQLNYEKNDKIELSFELLKWIDLQFHKSHKEEQQIEPSFLQKLYSQNYEEVQTVYKDSQNAHNVKIRNDIIVSMEQILEDPKPDVSFEDSCLGLLDKFKLEDSHTILLNSNIGEIGLKGRKYTLAELFPYIYQRIMNHEYRDSIVHILEGEIQRTKNVCFSGKIEGYVCALASFYDDVKFSPSMSDMILAKIELIKNRLHKDRIPADSLHYQVELRFYLEQELEGNEDKEVWLSPIDDCIEDLVGTLENHYGKDILEILNIIKMKKPIKNYFMELRKNKNNVVL
jgi:hypothetical protein